MVQLSHPYIITGKTVVLTRWTFVGKVMSLLFNMLSSFSSKEQAPFYFMAATTICSDFGAPQHKAFHCMDCNKLRKILKEMGMPDHLTSLLRNQYTGQESTARTRHGTTNWFQMGKGVRQGHILSPRLFNLSADYIMWNAGLDETQAGVKIARDKY